MINRDLSNQGLNDFRGFLTYQQEYGYKMITLTVGVRPDKQSHVIIHDGLGEWSQSEEPEHCFGTDLYYFSIIDGDRIQLLIETPAGNQEAWYTVHPDTIVAEPSPFSLNIGGSSESLPAPYAYTQDALDEALRHYASQVPHWLNETSDHKPLHEVGDFGR